MKTLILLAAALYAAAPRADVSLTVSQNIINSYSGNTVEIGYHTENWDFQFGAVTKGETFVDNGDTFRGYQHGTQIFTITRRWEWGEYLYGRFGGAVTPRHNLIGPVNFRFGGGLKFGNLELEYMHASSAGIFETNYGLDTLGLRFKF